MALAQGLWIVFEEGQLSAELFFHDQFRPLMICTAGLMAVTID
jgi:hypothetical protein